MNQQLTFKEMRDVRSAILFGAVGAAWVIIVAIIDISSMFTPDGILVTARFAADASPGTVEVGSVSAVAAVTEARFLAPDIPWLSTAGLVMAIVARALSYLIVIACGIGVCRSLTAGRAFSRQNARLVFMAGVGLFVCTLLVYMGMTLGLNGAFASIGYETDTMPANTPAGYWPSIFAGFALTVVAIAFRAGERLQRDTEGLV
ncbi:Protein of unknown function [Paramicrobacterium humi]|uniref:DUF2975 domain-containing protein n=1 Tax=Paramicrobacterium humi TaxID=640635 RepID=A0A1H4MRS8_9MICO|nr:DUF2975 domain-containing protein [Microbacterium humi]SEB85653.1 Protein of unknown function [Microbacterium humi]